MNEQIVCGTTTNKLDFSFFSALLLFCGLCVDYVLAVRNHIAKTYYNTNETK